VRILKPSTSFLQFPFARSCNPELSVKAPCMKIIAAVIRELCSSTLVGLRVEKPFAQDGSRGRAD